MWHSAPGMDICLARVLETLVVEAALGDRNRQGIMTGDHNSKVECFLTSLALDRGLMSTKGTPKSAEKMPGQILLCFP